MTARPAARRLVRRLTLAAAVLALAAPLAAPAPAALAAPPARPAPPALQETESGLRRSTIFMLIGAAAVVIGAVTDEGALVVGGAVLGLTGLYFRLR